MGEADNGEEALRQVTALRPDLVLMDINMPGMDGIEAARLIVGSDAAPVVFRCSTYQRGDAPPEAAASGAAAYRWTGKRAHPSEASGA